MKKALLLIIISLLIISCSSSDLTITKAKNDLTPQDTINYKSFWSIMKCAMPEKATNFTNDKDKLEFANSLSEILDGNFADAEKSLHNLMTNSKNDTIVYFSHILLEQSLIYQSKWKDYFTTFKNNEASDSAEIARLLYPIFMNNNESFRFNKDIDTIPFNIKKGLIFIPVEINGNTYEFLFDTGVAFSMLSKTVAEESNLKILSQNSNRAKSVVNLSANVETSIIDKLNIGKFTYNNKPCIVLDDDVFKFKFLFFTFLNMDGAIGWDIIKNWDITVDVENQKLYIKKPIKKENNNKNLFWMQHPIVKLKTMNGFDLLFNLDLGAQNSAFYQFLLNKIKVDNIKANSENVHGFGGARTINVQTIPEISFLLNDYQLNFTEFGSILENEDYFIMLDGMMGNDVLLKSKKVYLDATNGIFEIEIE